MADMLVPLYRLPSSRELVAELAGKGVTIRRANPWEIIRTRAFISKHFATAWADEASVGFAHQPVTTWLATENGAIVGFACTDCTRKGFFGPTGVDPDQRGRHIGKALLLVALEDMLAQGYAYAIIGGAGPKEFYARFCGAAEIPDSTPGIYTDMLK